MSQSTLAHLLGCTQVYISNIETSSETLGNMRTRRLLKIAEALGVPVNALVDSAARKAMVESIRLAEVARGLGGA